MDSLIHRIVRFIRPAIDLYIQTYQSPSYSPAVIKADEKVEVRKGGR